MNTTSNNVYTLNTTRENLQGTNSTYMPWALDDPNLIVHTTAMIVRSLQLLFGAITNILTVIVICKTDKLRTAGNQLVIGLADALMFLGE